MKISTNQLLLWGGIAVVGFIVYRKYIQNSPGLARNPTGVTGTGTQSGTPTNNSGFGTIVGDITGAAGTFEQSLNGIYNLFGTGSAAYSPVDTSGSPVNNPNGP